MPSNSQSTTVTTRLAFVLAVCVSLAAAVAAQPYTFEQIAAGLKSRDTATRLRAIQILKESDYQEAASPIAELLGDADDRVQLAAIDAERSFFTTAPASRRRKIGLVVEVRDVVGGDPAEAQLALKARVVPTLVLSGLAVALRDDNAKVRADALSATSLLAPDACARATGGAERELCGHLGDAVINNVNSRDPQLRRASMRALGQLRHRGASQALTDQLSYYQTGPDALAALDGLAGIGDPTSVSIFQPLLASPNADMRRLAVEGLARSGDRDTLPELQQLGQAERSNDVRLAIHYAIVRLAADTGSVAPLVTALNVPTQRARALSYLLDIAPAVAPVLASALQDPNPDTRRLLADVLGFSRNASVVPALEAAGKDADPDVVLAAQRAVERIKLTGAAALNR